MFVHGYVNITYLLLHFVQGNRNNNYYYYYQPSGLYYSAHASKSGSGPRVSAIQRLVPSLGCPSTTTAAAALRRTKRLLEQWGRSYIILLTYYVIKKIVWCKKETHARRPPL